MGEKGTEAKAAEEEELIHKVVRASGGPGPGMRVSSQKKAFASPHIAHC
jgi:hypothetical protein